MDFLPINSTLLMTILSAGAAFATFLAIAIPFLKSSEKKKRYQDVVEQKKRSLYYTVREQAKAKGNTVERSAAQNMAALYRVQQLAGATSRQARDFLLQAGIRSASAPLTYLISRIVVPLCFVAIAILFMSAAEKEMKDGMKFMIIFGGALIGFFLPKILIKNMADKRQLEISQTFPDALDMMLICVQGGIGIEGAISKIAEEVATLSEILAEELGLLSAELGLLNDRRAAFQGFSTRVGGGPAKSFATAMLQAEQYGTSISKAIRVLADEQRDMRMAMAEQKAASLPPKLTVPMILFFLPALFVTILGPAFLSTP